MSKKKCTRQIVHGLGWQWQWKNNSTEWNNGEMKDFLTRCTQKRDSERKRTKAGSTSSPTDVVPLDIDSLRLLLLLTLSKELSHQEEEEVGEEVLFSTWLVSAISSITSSSSSSPRELMRELDLFCFCFFFFSSFFARMRLRRLGDDFSAVETRFK